MLTRLLGLMLLIGASVSRAQGADELPLLFSEDFESGNLAHWSATDPTAWKIEIENGSQVLHQFRQSQVSTPVRCPFNRAVIRGINVSDFQLDVDLQTTARDYPHRSLCLFFGYQDPSHFYYVHLGQKADDHANQIFIVNAAPRVKISKTSTDGTPWDDKWHHVRIQRRIESGEIQVFFDKMDQPIMTASDKTFMGGEVGIGSFDDTGRFDRFELRGLPVAR
jgi:hypothetical protein